MEQTLVKNRISKEGKAEALDKWNKTVEKTKNGENFSSIWGFKKFNVVEECKYCEEFISCEYCVLFENNICYEGKGEGRNVLFWKYVKEMRKHLDGRKVNRKMVVTLSREIRDFIKNDPAEDGD